MKPLWNSLTFYEELGEKCISAFGSSEREVKEVWRGNSVFKEKKKNGKTQRNRKETVRIVNFDHREPPRLNFEDQILVSWVQKWAVAARSGTSWVCTIEIRRQHGSWGKFFWVSPQQAVFLGLLNGIKKFFVIEELKLRKNSPVEWVRTSPSICCFYCLYAVLFL